MGVLAMGDKARASSAGVSGIKEGTDELSVLGKAAVDVSTEWMRVTGALGTDERTDEPLETRKAVMDDCTERVRGREGPSESSNADRVADVIAHRG